ncbi:MAG: YkgJ family cysteine cluster protein [Nannocystaceae bacterium]|nr:YkgJ family cysteine cluster protein [Nannocystaceae bacterium]
MTQHDAQTARGALVMLRARVDVHFDEAARQAGDQMRCAQGCDQCCHVDLTVFTVEAAPVRDALQALPAATRDRVRAQADQTLHCAMLLDGLCAVYEHRPLICRSHGTAVLLEDGRVEHCQLNFTEAPPAKATVLRLAAVNQPLSVMATLWDGAGTRIALRALAAEP